MVLDWTNLGLKYIQEPVADMKVLDWTDRVLIYIQELAADMKGLEMDLTYNLELAMDMKVPGMGLMCIQVQEAAGDDDCDDAFWKNLVIKTK